MCVNCLKDLQMRLEVKLNVRGGGHAGGIQSVVFADKESTAPKAALAEGTKSESKLS